MFHWFNPFANGILQNAALFPTDFETRTERPPNYPRVPRSPPTSFAGGNRNAPIPLDSHYIGISFELQYFFTEKVKNRKVWAADFDAARYFWRNIALLPQFRLSAQIS
ncbi:MAG: hypothetical protein IIY32_01585 [Thermoguttaceae bacterium]|nr:hypothetical protein [Thermoguttaceae bacterium]